MLQFVAERVSARKKRLFLCGCARRMWNHFVVDWWQDAIGIAEGFADGLLTSEQLAIVNGRVWHCTGYVPEWPREDHQALLDLGINPTESCHSRTINFLILITRADRGLGGVSTYNGYRQIRERLEGLPALARDIVGNPFRPVVFNSSWRTKSTVSLASRMYEEREFAAMPILADALQEAGCEDADILTHCREPGTHVRGCWVVDLVLGKE